jgi:hypothetical protein
MKPDGDFDTSDFDNDGNRVPKPARPRKTTRMLRKHIHERDGDVLGNDSGDEGMDSAPETVGTRTRALPKGAKKEARRRGSPTRVSRTRKRK